MAIELCEVAIELRAANPPRPESAWHDRGF